MTYDEFKQAWVLALRESGLPGLVADDLHAMFARVKAASASSNARSATSREHATAGSLACRVPLWLSRRTWLAHGVRSERRGSRTRDAHAISTLHGHARAGGDTRAGRACRERHLGSRHFEHTWT